METKAPFEQFEVGSVIGGSNYIVRTQPKLDLEVWGDCGIDRDRERFVEAAIREKLERANGDKADGK